MAMTESCAWTVALGMLPDQVKNTILQDGYTSAEIFKKCFASDGAANGYERLDKYGN